MGRWGRVYLLSRLEKRRGVWKVWEVWKVCEVCEAQDSKKIGLQIFSDDKELAALVNQAMKSKCVKDKML